MKKNILWILGIALTVIIFAGVVALYNKLSEDYSPEYQTENTNDNGAEEAYSTAPDFTVTDSDGNEVRLSDYFGKPIVLNFWASWCPPCKEEMPYFEDAYKQYPEVQFLMVNMTTSDRESLSAAKEYIEEEGYSFPVLYDTKGEAAMTYVASSIPMSFFIDKDGGLVTYAVGMLSAENLKRGIDLIKE